MSSKLEMTDRLLLVQLYYQSNRSPTVTIRKFSTMRKIKSKRDAPTVTAVQNLIAKFESTYSLFDSRRSGRPSISGEYVDEVAGLLEQAHGQISTTQISRQLNIPQSTIYKIVTQHLQMYPYKFHMVHQLSEEDKVKRMEFCQNFLKQCDADKNWISKILFTDEAHFHLNGAVNTHNMRIWSTANPNEVIEQPLHSPKVTVFCGFCSKFITPPYFFEDDDEQTVTVTGDRYRRMLQTFLFPYLRSKRKMSSIIFQQDGATSHTANDTKQILSKNFGERVISKGFTFEWPPRSPDLNGCDYWLWGYLKANAYSPPPANLSQLKEKILLLISKIPQDMLKAVTDSLVPRAQLCFENNGGHINPKYN